MRTSLKLNYFFKNHEINILYDLVSQQFSKIGYYCNFINNLTKQFARCLFLKTYNRLYSITSTIFFNKSLFFVSISNMFELNPIQVIELCDPKKII